MNSGRFTCEQVARVLGEPIKRQGGELLWHCPNHQDAHPSLSVNPKKNLFMCGPCGAGGTPWKLAAFLAGCDTGDKSSVKAWLKAHGLLSGATSKGKPTEEGTNGKPNGRGRRTVAIYDYTDEAGKLLFQVLRYDPKAFIQRRSDGKGGWLWNLNGVRRVLYNLPEVLKAKAVLVVEGEKDVETARKLDLAATCNSGGAGKWKSEYSEPVRGKRVAIICDADATGLDHGRDVARSRVGIAASVKLIEALPHSKDLSEWVERGGTRDILIRIIVETKEVTPAVVASWDKPSVVAPGEELIRRFEEIFMRYIVAPKGVPLVGALYAFMTNCFEIFSWIGYLAFCSPLESCGKSQAADIVGWTSARPEIVVSITEAGLFRLITDSKPTVVIDEAEILAGDGETAAALRAVLHAGCAPDDSIIRCAPKSHDLQRFSPWCPKVFCYIGKLPRVLSSRCIEVGMKRKGSGEKVRAFIRHRVKAEASKLGEEITAWVAAHEAEIRRVYEALPDEAFADRGRQNFAPLEAILSVADPSRLSELRRGLYGLTAASNASLSDDAIQARLLLDVRAIFEEGKLDELPSTRLADELAKIETSPWGEWSKGKPLSPTKLSRLLKPFQVYPDHIQNGQARGYKLSSFRDVFERYLPIQSVKVSETQHPCGSDANFKVSKENSSDTLKNTVSASNDAPLRHFDTLKPGKGESGGKGGNLDGQHIAEKQSGLAPESSPAGWEI